MKYSAKTLFAGAAVVSALIAAAPVSAATIIVAFTGGPFSLTNPIGTLPATKLVKGNTYDFTFTMVPPLSGNTTSTQAQAQARVGTGNVPELIQYQLYEGTPGSGTLLATSALDYSPVVAFNAVPDNYYMEVTSAEIAKNNEVASGSIAAAVPEPAGWAMMLVGFGALGLALRRRSASTASFAV
jgi:hypothetical protein